jgi:hypothetical protein
MAIDTAQPQTSYDEWRTRRWRLTGLAFALAWLVVAAAVGLSGEKRSDLATLEASIADGSVTQVEIVGYPFSQGGTAVTLRWRGTLIHRFVEVDTLRRPDATPERDQVVGDPAEHLRALVSDVDITYSAPRGGAFLEWRDWRGPGWAATLGFATWFGTVLLAGSGPEPWRATKWAWIWLILFAGPIGSVAFLLLGGPLGLWRPKDPGRRLTGGWAFLLALFLLGGDNAT